MDFYADLQKLILSKPHNAVSSRAIENCAFGDYLYRSKNIYLSWFISDGEDCFYSEYIAKGRDCVDCNYLTASELCYECVDCLGLYNCSYLQDCGNCSESDYCLDCLNCKNCFGCFGLRHRQFCVFNKTYTESEYKEKVAELKKNSPSKVFAILRPEFEKYPRLYARMLKGGENSFGDYIYFSKDCYMCFNIRDVAGAAYSYDVLNPEAGSHDIVDCNFVGAMENCYECQDSSSCNNCNFLEHSTFCSDSEYLMYCYNCQNCFGCAYLMNKQYCILNKQLTREEYLLALAKIKNDLKTAKTYGKTLAEVLK